MTSTINSVWLSRNSITFREFATLKVMTNLDPVVTTAIVNNKHIGLTLIETGATEKRWEAELSGYTIGTVSAGTIDIYSHDSSTVDTDSTLSITVTASSYIRPMEWGKNYLKTNWNTSNCPLPEIVLVTERKRIDRAVSDWIIIKQRPRRRKIRGRGQYKDVSYPIILELGTTYIKDKESDTGERKDQLLQEVRRIIELDWNFLPSNEDYDFIRWVNDGEDVSMGSARAFKFIYEFELVKLFKKLP